MLRRALPILCFLAAVPARAEEEHHCLEHHWMGPEYYGELRWQLTAMALMLLAFGLARGFRWWRRRTV